MTRINNIDSFNKLNAALENATVSVTWRRGVKIEMEGELVTRNAIVRLAETFKEQGSRKEIKKFNRLIQDLNTKVQEEYEKKSKFTHGMTRIRQFFGNLRFKRHELLVPPKPPKEEPTPPSHKTSSKSGSPSKSSEESVEDGCQPVIDPTTEPAAVKPPENPVVHDQQQVEEDSHEAPQDELSSESEENPVIQDEPKVEEQSDEAPQNELSSESEENPVIQDEPKVEEQSDEAPQNELSSESEDKPTEDLSKGMIAEPAVAKEPHVQHRSGGSKGQAPRKESRRSQEAEKLQKTPVSKTENPVHVAKKLLFTFFGMNIPISRLEGNDKIAEISKNLKHFMADTFKSERPAGFIVIENGKEIEIERSRRGEYTADQLVYIEEIMIHILSGEPIASAFKISRIPAKGLFIEFKSNLVEESEEELAASVLTRSIEVGNTEVKLTEDEFHMVEEAGKHPESAESQSILTAVWEKAKAPLSIFSYGFGAVAAVPGKLASGAGVVAAVPGQIVSGVAAVGSAAANLVHQGIKTVGAAERFKQQALEGVDFYPYMVKGAGLGKKGVDALTAYWNAPAAEYDPMMATIVESFANKFGTKLHFILINGCKLGCDEFSGKIAEKLNLGTVAAKIGAQKVLSFSNPLGWINMVLMLSNYGVNIAQEFRKGILGELSASIDAYVLKMAASQGLNTQFLELLLLENMGKAASKRFEEEKKAFLQKLEDEGKKPPEEEIGGFWNRLKNFGGPKWYEQYLKEAPNSYYEAEQKVRTVSTLVAEFRENHPALRSIDYTTKQGIALALRYKPFVYTAVALKNSAKKTLEHMVDDLCGMIAAQPDDEQEALDTNKKSIMESILRALVQGSDWKPLETAANAPEDLGTVNQAAGVVKKVFTNPLSALTDYIPQFNDGLNSFLKPASHAMGQAAGQMLVQGNLLETIKGYDLQNLHAFNWDQMQFNIREKVQDERMNTVLDAVEHFYNVNTGARTIMEKTGEVLADRLALQFAKVLKSKLGKNSPYTVEDLMSKEIEDTYLNRGLRAAGQYATGAVVGLFGFAARKTKDVSDLYDFCVGRTYPTDF